jgi:hypothetical protein
MTKSPVPLRADYNRAADNVLLSLARAVVLHVRQLREPSSRLVKNPWSDDDAIAMVQRAVTNVATTAGALTQIARQYLTALQPLSATAYVLARAIQIPFGPALPTTFPTLTLPSAKWIGETHAIPVVSGQSTNGITIDMAYKLAVAVVVTNELIRAANADDIVKQLFLENLGPSWDAAFFSTGAGTPGVQPPGILNGITPLPASNAQGINAMVDDLSTIAQALAPVSGSGQPVLITSPGAAVVISIMATQYAWPVIPCSSLDARTAIGMIPEALVASVEVPRIESSRQASVQFNDAPGDELMVGGIVGSVFQTDETIVRLISPATWALRSKAGIAVINNVAWTKAAPLAVADTAPERKR